jgi:hypothetical protein
MGERRSVTGASPRGQASRRRQWWSRHTVVHASRQRLRTYGVRSAARQRLPHWHPWDGRTRYNRPGGSNHRGAAAVENRLMRLPSNARAHGHIEHAVDVAVPPGVLWPQLPAKAIERRTMDKGETRQPGRSLRIRQWLEVDRQAAPAERHALRPSVHWPGGVGLRGAPSRVHAVKHDRSVRGWCGSPLRPPGAAHWPDRPSCLH